jgi:hypothetical protein
MRSLTARYDKPDRVHPDKIRPEIERLGAIVLLAQYIIIIQAGCEIKEITVDMARRHECLQGMAITRITAYQPGCEEG